MMKSKNTYILLASVLMLASSCQKEIGLIESGNDGLSFSVSYASTSSQASTKGGNVAFTDENGNPAPFTINLSVEDTKVEPVTKGTPINNLAKFVETFDAFRAWGWAKSGSNWTDVWNSGNGTKIKQIEPGSTEYRPVDNSDNFIKAYDPAAVASGQYRFYALAPYELSSPEVTSLTCAYDKLSFTYTSPGGAGGTTDAELQKEVLAGYMASGAKLTKDVPLTFSPALAAIRFIVSDEILGRNITINSIELANFVSTATCTVSQSGVSWSIPATPTRKTYKQTFDFSVNISNDKGKSIDAIGDKTFFVIPQTGSSSLSNGSKIIINYTDNTGTHTGAEAGLHLVYGNTFEAGKTYVYKIGNFDNGSNSKLEPWAEFSHFEAYPANLVADPNEIKEENNSKFVFNFKMNNGSYEKANFKIHNLKEGHWYQIEFTERLSAYKVNTNGTISSLTTFGTPGTYACTVGSSINSSTGGADQLSYYTTARESDPPFIWQHPDNIYDKTEYDSFFPIGETNPENARKAKLTFKATAETMYWQWDYSKGNDDGILKAEIYLVGDKIKDITPVYADESHPTATVDFLNATLYNGAHTSTYVANNSSISSHKTYAVDATLEGAVGELYFRFKNIGNGRLNIPLTNLTFGKKYRITSKYMTKI